MSKEKEHLDRLEEKLDNLALQVQSLKEIQNSQYTDIILEFKKLEAILDEKDIRDLEFFDIDNEHLYEKAVNIASEFKKVSSSFLQRKLRIKYLLAVEIIQKMQSEGLLSEYDNGIYFFIDKNNHSN